MSECRQYSRWIALFVSGDLDEAQTDRLRGHLAQCEDCAVTVARYREDRRALARYARVVQSETESVAGDNWWDEIREQLGDIGASPSRLRRLRLVRRWALAAGLLFAVVLGFEFADWSMRPIDGSADSPSIQILYPNGLRSFGAEGVAYPIQNFSHPVVPQGFDLDVDPSPNAASPDQPIDPLRLRLPAVPPRLQYY